MTADSAAHAAPSKVATPDAVETALREAETVLIDVREPVEFRAEWIEGARNYPLGTIDPAAIAHDHDGNAIILHCQSGSRSASAAKKFRAAGIEVTELAGGIEAWRASGKPTQKSTNAPRIPIMRQVQITAGTLVLTGVLLGTLVHPGFYGLSAFVGAGLVFAGISGWCGMAKLLATMPWNR